MKGNLKKRYQVIFYPSDNVLTADFSEISHTQNECPMKPLHCKRVFFLRNTKS